MVRAINIHTLLRERATGRVGSIVAFRLDLHPRNVVVLVKFEGANNCVSFTGLHNIIESFEVVRRVNGRVRSEDDDRLQVLTEADDLNSSRTSEKLRRGD